MKFGQWLKTHKNEAMLAGGGVVVAIALYVKSQSSSSGSSSTDATEVPATADTTDSDVYNALEGQIESLSGAVSTLQGLSPGSSSTATSSGAAAAGSSAASSGPGFGDVSVGGQSYVELGEEGVGSYYGYNVGGGAPVYYEDPGSTNLQTDLTPEAVAGLPAGTEVLTPSFWGSQVSANPVTGKR